MLIVITSLLPVLHFPIEWLCFLISLSMTEDGSDGFGIFLDLSCSDGRNWWLGNAVIIILNTHCTDLHRNKYIFFTVYKLMYYVLQLVCWLCITALISSPIVLWGFLEVSKPGHLHSQTWQILKSSISHIFFLCTNVDQTMQTICVNILYPLREKCLFTDVYMHNTMCLVCLCRV